MNAAAVAAVALVCALTVHAAPAAPEPGTSSMRPATGGGTADHILLTVDDARDAVDRLTRLASDYDLELVDSRPLHTLEARCAVLAVDSRDDRDTIVLRLRADPRVSNVQPMFVHAVAGMPPKDPYFDLQTRTRQGGVASILQRGTGLRVRIAIIDTGVDLNHPDIVGQVAASRNFVGGDETAVPSEYHGTAVTGLIAARAGNGIGIHGLAPNGETHALRACWEPTYGYGLCSTYTLAQALDYAIEIRARLINLSLAGPDDPLLTRLVERAIELGAVVFGAVGEDPSQSFPTSIASVIAVDHGDRTATPVAGIRVTIPGQQLLSTVPGGRYDFVSGSSFAAAHATGVAAVMLEQQPHLQASDLASWLRQLHDDTKGP